MPFPPLLSDPYFYVVGVTAVLLLGISKSGFPGSFGAMGVLQTVPARAGASRLRRPACRVTEVARDLASTCGHGLGDTQKQVAGRSSIWAGADSFSKRGRRAPCSSSPWVDVLATAELIHAQNFEKVLAGLVGEVAPVPEHPVAVGSTKQKLVTAATDELASVDAFYPGMLKDLAPEGLQDAIKFTTYAWNAEKLHLNILSSIERWTPRHFEAVAKKIENETAQYLVCQICGATMVKLPEESCPVCELPASNIHKIEPPSV